MQEIGLQELIDQVKQELLAPNKDPNPLFFIDKIELEMAVKVTKEADGNIKISVLNFFEGGAGGSLTRERGHVVKVSISPLLERDEIVKKFKDDPHTHEAIKRASQKAFTKESGMAGEEQ